jgi:hypothetical protein
LILVHRSRGLMRVCGLILVPSGLSLMLVCGLLDQGQGRPTRPTPVDLPDELLPKRGFGIRRRVQTQNSRPLTLGDRNGIARQIGLALGDAGPLQGEARSIATTAIANA